MIKAHGLSLASSQGGQIWAGFSLGLGFITTFLEAPPSFLLQIVSTAGRRAIIFGWSLSHLVLTLF